MSLIINDLHSFKIQNYSFRIKSNEQFNKMLVHEIQRRVSYGETDKMGYLYYGHYAHYFEIGRVEMLRHFGLNYRDLEDIYQIMLPVSSLKMRFVRPGLYDDLITIRTTLKSYSQKSMVFQTKLFNEQGKLMNVGEVRLVFVDANTMKGCPPPSILTDRLDELTQKEN